MTKLLDVIGTAATSNPQYCSDAYWEWEDNVARPLLLALGYERVTFHNGERDSFGPLTRFARAYKNGVCYELVYG